MRERVRVQVSKLKVKEQDLAALLRSLKLVGMICLSLFGSMVRLPLPTGQVALETFPGYFTALTFGWLDGALVAGISHFLVASSNGFPLGIWLHLLAGVQMAVWAVCFWFFSKKVGLLTSILTITLLHALVSVIYILPLWNMLVFTGLFVPLAVAAGINLFISAFLFKFLQIRNK